MSSTEQHEWRGLPGEARVVSVCVSWMIRLQGNDGVLERDHVELRRLPLVAGPRNRLPVASENLLQ
jgi:hypothetical protein